MDEKRKVLKLVQFYSVRIREDSLDVTNFVFRSECYEYLKEYRKSLRDAIQIITIDPSYWKGHHQLMKMHIKLGHLPEAEEIAERFRENDLFRKISIEVERLRKINGNISNAKNEKDFDRELKKAREISPGSRKYQSLTYEKLKNLLIRSNSAPKLSDHKENQSDYRQRTHSNGFTGKRKQTNQIEDDSHQYTKEGKCSIS